MERLTIDEIIEHCDRNSKNYEHNVPLDVLSNQPLTNTTRLYWEHKQVSEYLKELKRYRDLEESLEKTYGDCPGLLKTVVNTLVTRADQVNSVLGEKPAKARLLTDEDVDMWAEYKQLEEQGKLLKLPCKVGDTVYEVNADRNIISTLVVTRITIYPLSIQFNWKLVDGVYKNIAGFADFHIGDTVFLTKSEAEAKLKELRGGENGTVEL